MKVLDDLLSVVVLLGMIVLILATMYFVVWSIMSA